jgi:hypothetical protein
MKTDREENHYKYLSYVTMREAWEICKTFFWVWFLFSVFSVVLGGVFNVGIDIAKSETGIDSNSLPQWAWVAIIISGIMWFCKGKDVSFKFPNLQFKSWLLCSVIILIVTAILSNAPWWAGAPFYFALIVLGVVIDDLSAKGNENYAKLKPESLETLDSVVMR